MRRDVARLRPSLGQSVTCGDTSMYRRWRGLLRPDVVFSACFCSTHEDMAQRAFKSAQREAYRLIQSTSLGKERPPTAQPSQAQQLSLLPRKSRVAHRRARIYGALSLSAFCDDQRHLNFRQTIRTRPNTDKMTKINTCMLCAATTAAMLPHTDPRPPQLCLLPEESRARRTSLPLPASAAPS